MLNITVEIGWKFVVALGVGGGLLILASKVDGPAAERVLTHAADACKEQAIANRIR